MDSLSIYTPTLSYIAVLFVAGLVGNTIVVVIYYRRFQPSTTRTYILAMSVTDLLTNAVSLPMEFVFRYLTTVDFGQWCRVNGTVKSFLVLCSTFILVAVAHDRYRAICQPMKRQATPARTSRILWLCAVLAVCGTVPHTVLIGRQTTTFIDRGANVTRYSCFVDDVFVGSSYLDGYMVITISFFSVCAAVMVTSYLLIARRLWRHRQATMRRTNDNSRSTFYRFATSDGNDPTADSERGTGEQCLPDSTEDDLQELKDDKNPKVQEFTLQDLGQNQPGVNPSSDDVDDSATSGQHQAQGLSAAEARMSSDNLDSDHNPNSARGLSTQGNLSCATSSGKSDPSTSKTYPKRNVNFGNKGSAEGASETAPQVSSVKSSSAREASGAQRDAKQDTVSASDQLHRLNVVNLAKPESATESSTTQNLQGLSDRSASSDATTKRGQWRSVKKIPRSTTLMMFVLTAVFVVNFLPYLVTLRLFEGRDRIDASPWGLNLYHLAQRCYFINSAVNPLVYGFCSASFRRQCRLLFHCKGTTH